MRIKLTSVFVNDQAEALKFYTEKLGFVKKIDLPAGEFRWLIVVSPEEPDGVEMLLEPSEKPYTQDFKKALYDEGIPLVSFAVEDLQSEYDRLRGLGVRFVMEPTPAGPTVIAILDDTCGNLVQLYQG